MTKRQDKIDLRNRLIIFAVSAAVSLAIVGIALARDADGRYADSPLHSWFNQLASKKGLCCSMADGMTVTDPDWDTKDGHYRVRLEGVWIDVPPDAVITEPNRAGLTMVWPYYLDGELKSIRCFIAGNMS